MKREIKECCEKCFKWGDKYGEYVHPCNEPDCECHCKCTIDFRSPDCPIHAGFTIKRPKRPTCKKCDGTGSYKIPVSSPIMAPYGKNDTTSVPCECVFNHKTTQKQ